MTIAELQNSGALSQVEAAFIHHPAKDVYSDFTKLLALLDILKSQIVFGSVLTLPIQPDAVLGALL